MRETKLNGDIYAIRWREGWRTLVYLYRHPDDTAQIARVIEAFQGRSVPRLMRRLRASTAGRELLAQRPSLRDALADRMWLESLPEGSLGRAFVEFCREEGLATSMTPHVESGTTRERTARLPADERFIQDFLFHAHDIYHLVTGYRTDLVGEVCLLAFSAAQLRNTGVIAMAMLGLYSLRLPRLAGQRLAFEALVRGLRAEWLPEQDWVALMSEPLADVRKRLGLDPVPEYTQVYIGRAKKRKAASQAANRSAVVS